MSQSPLTRQVLNNAPNNNAASPAKPSPRVSIRKPAKRIAVKKDAADAQADDEEPQLIMSPVVAAVSIPTGGDGEDDEDLPVLTSSPITKTVTLKDDDSRAEAPKISLRRGSLHQNTATSPMITLSTPRKDEEDAAVIIAEAAPSNNNSNQQPQTADAQQPAADASAAKAQRLKKKQEQAPLAFLKTLPSAMNEAMKNNSPQPAAQTPAQRGPDSPVIGGAKSVSFGKDDASATRKSVNSAASSGAISAQLGAVGANNANASAYNYSSLAIPDNVTSILHLSEAERKELYPSDDDEDFDNYLFDMMQGRENDDDGAADSKTPNKGITETSLKFNEFIKNPLYDTNAPPAKEIVVQLTRDDVIRLNEVARRARERGDIHYKNYKMIDKLDKDLYKEYKSKLMTRRLSTMVRRSEKNAPIHAKDIKELEELRRGSVEASSFSFADDEAVASAKVSGKYDIRQCSRSWKTQLRNLQVVTSSNTNEAASGEKKAEEPRRKTSMFLPPHFSSHASIMKQGYMPEWKYALHCKRLLDASKNVQTKA